MLVVGKFNMRYGQLRGTRIRAIQFLLEKVNVNGWGPEQCRYWLNYNGFSYYNIKRIMLAIFGHE